MLRTRAAEVSLWEAVLPEAVLRLPEELARVDALLDDPVFFASFAPFFDPRLGRPSTPMEVYLRLMFLKFRYRLGYETLCREVADSITWRQFCRIPLDGQVPHPTTLMRLTTRCGTDDGRQIDRRVDEPEHLRLQAESWMLCGGIDGTGTPRRCGANVHVVGRVGLRKRRPGLRRNGWLDNR